MMGPQHGSTLSVLATIILGALLLSANFLPAEATVLINFVAAEGPVPVGGYLQITTLLRNNDTASPPYIPFAYLAISVTCSDALIILPGATLRSPGCTNPVSVPPYPVGTPVGGPYPGCDKTPLGVRDLTENPYPVTPSISADGHTAFWRNYEIPGGPREPTVLYFHGLVTKYQPIVCVATVTPSNDSSQPDSEPPYAIPNPVYGVTGASRDYLKEGLVYTNIIPPPPPSPGSTSPGYTGVPTSTRTLVVTATFIPIPVNGPPCTPGTVSSTSMTNTTVLIGNTTRCNTTEIRTVTNTTTCVIGGADRLVNTTTTTLVKCLPIFAVDEPPVPTFNVPLAPNVTPVPTPTPSKLSTGVPTSTTLPPGITSGPPIPTTATPVPTATAPAPTSAAPVPTSAAPVQTSATPVPTTVAPTPLRTL